MRADDYTSLSRAELDLKRNEVEANLARLRAEITRRTMATAILSGDSLFDFYKYPEEYQILYRYFGGLDFYLRMANFVKYLELNCPAASDRERWRKSFETRSDRSEYLSTITEGGDYAELLANWFNHFDPEQNTEARLQQLLLDYSDKMDVLFNLLYKEYVDAGWVPSSKLPTLRYRIRKPDAKVEAKTAVEDLDLDKLAKSTGRGGYTNEVLKMALLARRLPTGGTKIEKVKRLLQYYGRPLP